MKSCPVCGSRDVRMEEWVSRVSGLEPVSFARVACRCGCVGPKAKSADLDESLAGKAEELWNTRREAIVENHTARKLAGTLKRPKARRKR